jgi:hypothetical protein
MVQKYNVLREILEYVMREYARMPLSECASANAFQANVFDDNKGQDKLREGG